MPESKRFERKPAGGSQSATEAGEEPARGTDDQNAHGPADEHPMGSLPPFTDPAFSSKVAAPPVTDSAANTMHPPKDTQYAGHPAFSQDAAANKPPKGIGNSKPIDDVEQKTRQSDGQDMKGADLRIAPAKRE